jgi:hypothetical protein
MFGKAMSPAEKQRRYRERKAQKSFGNKAAVTKPGKQSFGKDAVTKRLAELEAEIARLKADKAELARVRERDEQAGAASLSMTAQQKLEAYKRQIEREVTRKLEAQFEQRVNDEARRWFDQSLQSWCNRFAAAERQVKEWDKMFNRRKPILSKRMFRLVKASVQPDKGGTHDVAAEFNSKAEVIETVLCGSEAEQRDWARVSSLPRSVEELMAAGEKRRARDSAKAKRAAATRAANKAASKPDR